MRTKTTTRLSKNKFVIESGHGTSALNVEAADEHRTPFQDHLFGVVEVFIGPRHRVAQGLVARQSAPGADQKSESVIETVTDLPRGHRCHARRRKLNGQRDTVEAATYLHHRGGFVFPSE